MHSSLEPAGASRLSLPGAQQLGASPVRSGTQAERARARSSLLELDVHRGIEKGDICADSTRAVFGAHCQREA